MRFSTMANVGGRTPLVRLRHLSPPGYDLYLKLEGANPTGSVWDRVAATLVREVERCGYLKPGQRVLGPASGNAAVALAAHCRIRGYPFTCVVPEGLPAEHMQSLVAFGAEVVLSPADEGLGGSIRLARQMAAADPEVFMPFQYGNTANALAHHETTAPEIIADLPDVTAFVGGLGTGGTVTGVGKRLKRWNPDVKVYAAEPEYGDLVDGLRNLDEGYVPEVLDLDVLDGRIKVDSLRALEAARRLVAEEGIFAGVSTGASLAVAIRVCARLPEGSKVVALSPDGGWKYLSTGAYAPGDVKEIATAISGTLWA